MATIMTHHRTPDIIKAALRTLDMSQAIIRLAALVHMATTMVIMVQVTMEVIIHLV